MINPHEAREKNFHLHFSVIRMGWKGTSRASRSLKVAVSGHSRAAH